MEFKIFKNLFKSNFKISKEDHKKNQKKEKIFIICGASCTGKDTLLNILKEKYNLNTLISHTTRPQREGEKEGTDYYFIKKSKFISMINNNEFIEYKRYVLQELSDKKVTWFYGTSKEEFENKDKKICVLDVEGIKNLEKYCGKNNLTIIYLKADENIRKQRAEIRGSFNEDQWEKRKQFDNNIFNKNFEKEYSKFIIYNNNSKEFLESQADKIMKACGINKA